MPAKLVIKVYPDERVEVRVEGLTAKDQDRPAEKKLCKQVTRSLERDLGEVTQCVYCDDDRGGNVELTNSDQLGLGN